MEDILKEAAKQAPALVILLILCIIFAKSGAVVVKSFLTHLAQMRDEHLAHANMARSEYLKAIERFHQDNMEARALNRVTLSDNTTATDNQSKAIHELTMEVRELRSMLSPVIRKLQS